ncbi:MAG: DegT/DnrJ/EryC1/StrS family aminotransferase [Sedimentisphaerales bacterium]
MIRLTVPSIDENDLQAVRDALASGYLVQGARVAAFEQAVAQYVGTKYAVAVSSCTAALHISLLALAVQPGDLVIVTAYSWPATANVIELCGAKPVFVDIQRDTFNMDPACLKVVLEELMGSKQTRQRVKGILPVHTFGQMADMKVIMELAHQYGLPVIEDAACALGATLHGRQAGTWGALGCFSFHPRKAITTGEGGMVVTDNEALARCLRALRNHGQDPQASSPDFIMAGFNYRMTEFQAALGITQMAKLDSIIAARCRLAARYDRLLRNTTIKVPAVASGSQHVYQSYVALLPAEVAGRRDEIIAGLKERGIETTIGTWHIPMITYFRRRYGYKMGDFPATDETFACAMTLPLHKKLSEKEQEKIVECLAAEIS